MKKRDLLELLQWELSGGEMTADQLGKWDERILAKRVDIEWNKILIEIYNAVKKANYFGTFDSLTKSFTISLYYDATRKEYWAYLPPLASIPNDIAVRSIRPADSPDVEYIQIAQGSLPVFAKLPVNTIVGDMMYYIEGNKVYFKNHNGSSRALARVVCPFSSFADEDEIPEPVGMNGNVYDIVLANIRGVQMIPQDKKNDNTDTRQ